MDPLSLFFNSTAAVEGAVSAADSIKALSKKRGKGPLVHELAAPAYMDFEAAATGWLFDVHMVVEMGVPPKLQGSLWSYPTVFRSVRSMQTAARELVVAYARITTCGSDQACGAGYDVGVAVGKTAEAAANSRVGRRLQATPAFMQAKEGTAAAIASFADVARADLAIPARAARGDYEPHE